MEISRNRAESFLGPVKRRFMKVLMILLVVCLWITAQADVLLKKHEVTIAFGKYDPSGSVHTTLYVGNSKKLKQEFFLKRLESHVSLVVELMKSLNLVSYVVYPTDDQEVAVMQWSSETAMNQAFKEVGKQIQEDGGEFLETKTWKPLTILPKKLDLNFFERALK